MLLSTHAPPPSLSLRSSHFLRLPSPTASHLPSSAAPPCPSLHRRHRSNAPLRRHSTTHSSPPVTQRLLLSGCFSLGAPLAIAASTAEQETEQELGFVEIGYISSVHGIRGEMRVKPTTAFPELRFSQPGRRWLRTTVLGKESIMEVELIGGRNHHGQKSWIISLGGIDTVEQARQIVGSTLLVREEDRPDLEEGEFYTSDLIGMKVVLKETGKFVGTVVNIFNTGASDLLHVRLTSTVEVLGHSSSSKPESGDSGPLVWIPFVEAIVPDVYMARREMHITPPKGLLELNVRSDMRSKKERRQMEWKERKKMQLRLTAAKKKICDLGQEHLLEGFSFGDKAQKSLLTNQIVDINFKLFKHALQSVSTTGRFTFSEFMDANSAVLGKNTLNVAQRFLRSCASGEINGINSELYKEGHQLLKKSKAAIIIMNDENRWKEHSDPDEVSVRRVESKFLQFQELFLDYRKFLKVEEQDITIPIVLVSPATDIQSFEEFLSDSDYLHLEGQKVQFIEEVKLPIVSSYTEKKSGKMLLQSPWQVLQAPIGSGGVFSLLSSRKLVDDLIQEGIDYVQVCSLSHKSAIGHPLFFGLMKSRGADLGIKIIEGSNGDDEFDMIFSIKQLDKICKQIDKMQFYAVPGQHEHVELVDKEWIHVHPGGPNSFSFGCSIYSCLNTCPLDSMCVMQISE